MSEIMKADLHCHTTLSDGSLGIEEVISQAKRAGVTHLAITDHDTLSSLSRAAVLGKRYGVKIIPAVEISAFDGSRGVKAHILCYMPAKPDRLEGLCLRTTENRKKRGRNMANKVVSKYPISLDNIARYAGGSKAIYRCHIMHALMDYGYTIDLYGDIYNEIFDINSGLCAEEVKHEIHEYPEVHFALQLIHSSGGLAVLAHPNVYNNFDLVEELAQKGEIDGVEVWHRSLSEPDDRQKLIEIADKYGLITTGGSDFHGFYNHYAISIGDNITPPESLVKMKALCKKEIHI
ncbi:MAG: PHP domain-containing protein [Oscillospiraceae bacterium]|nr:PHP domain-containing protein [Oscillospiraceae bacterium]